MLRIRRTMDTWGRKEEVGTRMHGNTEGIGVDGR
jgi:hypothetical protein